MKYLCIHLCMLIKKENIPTPNPRGWSLILLGWQNWEEVAVLQANKQFTVGESLLPVLFSEAPLILAEPSQLPNCTSFPLNTDLYLTLTVHKHEGFQRWKGGTEHNSILKWKQGSKRWNPHPRLPRRSKVQGRDNVAGAKGISQRIQKASLLCSSWT